MKAEEQPKLKFLGVSITDVNYDGSQLMLDAKELDIETDIRPAVFYPKDQTDAFNIIMHALVHAKNFFTLSVKAVGWFQVSAELDQDIKERFVNSNAVAIMFPYLRAFITTFTANLGEGMSSIVIPTRFFHGELDILEEENSEFGSEALDE